MIIKSRRQMTGGTSVLFGNFLRKTSAEPYRRGDFG